MTHPLGHPQVRRSLVLALVVAVVGVAVFVLGPTGELPSKAVLKTSAVLRNRGFPQWVTDTGLWSFLYNVVLFVPVAFACALLWRRAPVAVWVVLGFFGSLGIEGVQALFLAGRDAQVQDLVSNTLGAAVGAALARLVNWSVTAGASPRAGLRGWASAAAPGPPQEGASRRRPRRRRT